jgi:hypothetical protein
VLPRPGGRSVSLLAPPGRVFDPLPTAMRT